MNKNESGYILIVTLMVISLTVALISYVFTNGLVFAPYISTQIAREKAKLLAQSGIQCALAQLGQEITLAKEQPVSGLGQTAQKVSPADQAAQEYLQRLLPALNRWQTFELKEEVDGIDGQIKFAITSEEGKIDINAWYDFKNHTFKGNEAQKNIAKTVFAILFKQLGKAELYDEFEKFLKKRNYRLDDITELLTIKGFDRFKSKIYYQPPQGKTAQEKNEQPSDLYLTDIFTVWSGKQTLDPWLFSDSVNGIIGLPRAQANDVANRKKTINQFVKNYKASMQFPSDWKTIFQPLYQKDLASLPKGIEFIFSTAFEPKMFSVLAHGTFGKVTQKMLALVESNKQIKDNVVTFNVTIKKVFWL